MPISTNVAVVVGLADSSPSALGSTTRSGVVAIANYVTATGAVETAWSMDLGSGVSAAYLFDFDVTAVSDDGLDFATYKWFHSVSWDGSAVAQLAAPASVISVETSPASCSATSDVSGTTVRLRVGATADWRYGGTVRVTKMEF